MSNNVIANVAGHEVTEADFEAFKKTLPQEQQAYLQSPEAVEYFKEQFIGLYLFAELGQEEKFDETEEFKSIMENTKRDLLGQMAMRKVLGAITVSDEDAKTYYDENKALFQKPETAHAKHILMENEDEIKDVQKNIESGDITFEEAAQKHSTCPSGQQGGDLGDFGRGQMVKEFEDAAFDAELGKMVGPVKTQFGYHLIKVDSKNEAGTSDFEEVKDQVKSNLMQQKQQEAYDAKIKELKEKYCK